MSSLAQVLGSFFVDYLLDRFGRKYTSAATGAFTLLGTGLQYHSTTRGVLLAGKIVNGLGIGAAMATATACASELYFNHASTQNDSDMARSRPSICVGPFNPRRPIQSGLVLFTVAMLGLALGAIRIFVPNIQERAFRSVIAIQWAVGYLLTLAFLFVPEYEFSKYASESDTGIFQIPSVSDHQQSH